MSRHSKQQHDTNFAHGAPCQCAGTGRRPRFSWHPTMAGETYTIRIDTVPARAEPVITAETTDTVYTPPVGLAPGRYVWRVQSSVKPAFVSIWDTVRIAPKVDVLNTRPVATRFTVSPGGGRTPLCIDYSLAEFSPIIFSLYSMRGECVVQYRAQRSPGTYRWTAPRLPGGIYVLHVGLGGRTYSRRMVRAVR